MRVDTVNLQVWPATSDIYKVFFHSKALYTCFHVVRAMAFWNKSRSKVVSDEKKQENALMSAKNRQLAAMRNMVDSQANIIDAQADNMSKYAKSINETKVVDAIIENVPTILDALGIKVPKPKNKTIDVKAETQETLESGKLYSDDELHDQISKVQRLAPGRLKEAVASGKEKFMETVRTNVPDISDESAEKSFKIAKVMINE